MDIVQKQEQVILLNLQQLHSITLLQMNAIEISEYLNELALDNPVIEINEQYEKEIHRLKDYIDGENTYRKELPKRAENDLDFREDAIENLSIGDEFSETLVISLFRQIERTAAEEEVKYAARCIAAMLEEDGYLRISLEKISEEAGLPLDIMQKGNELLRSLDPPGIGARSLSDCLVLQLERLNSDEYVVLIAKDWLETLSKGRIKEIAKELDISVEKVLKARETIQLLDPRPGAQFDDRRQKNYIYPDIIVEKDEKGTLSVHLTSEKAEPFFISETYLKLLKKTEDAEVCAYLTEKIEQAKMIQGALRQRKETLRRCAEIILEYQMDFFRNGQAYLRPLTIKDMAKEMNIHVSTAYRSVRGKYLQCQYGTYSVNYFFARKMSSETGSYVNTASVKKHIKQLIDQEKNGRPLTDESLCKKLAEAGLRVSRRTVTKYRVELGIPNSFERTKADALQPVRQRKNNRGG